MSGRGSSSIMNNEYIALLEALPDYLKPVLALGTFSGWRVMEILNLKCHRLELEQGKAWIAPGETKNKEGREIYLDADLLGKLNVLRAKRNPLCPYFFQRDAQKINRFTKAWETLLRACGLIPLLIKGLIIVLTSCCIFCRFMIKVCTDAVGGFLDEAKMTYNRTLESIGRSNTLPANGVIL